MRPGEGGPGPKVTGSSHGAERSHPGPHPSVVAASLARCEVCCAQLPGSPAVRSQEVSQHTVSSQGPPALLLGGAVTLSESPQGSSLYREGVNLGIWKPHLLLGQKKTTGGRAAPRKNCGVVCLPHPCMAHYWGRPRWSSAVEVVVVGFPSPSLPFSALAASVLQGPGVFGSGGGRAGWRASGLSQCGELSNKAAPSLKKAISCRAAKNVPERA